jgi:hypothetical protein
VFARAMLTANGILARLRAAASLYAPGNDLQTQAPGRPADDAGRATCLISSSSAKRSDIPHLLDGAIGLGIALALTVDIALMVATLLPMATARALAMAGMGTAAPAMAVENRNNSWRDRRLGLQHH